MKLAQVLLRGTRGAQPAANSRAPGTLYFVTNEGLTEQTDGTAWLTYSGTGGGGGAPSTATYLVAVSNGSSLPNSIALDTLGAGFLFTNGSGGLIADPTVDLVTQTSGILTVAKGGTGTATPGLVNGTLISVTGSWPNQTVNFTGTQLASPLTTKGDLWGYSTVNARIPVGTDAFVLTADSTQTLGVKWAAAGGGGSGTVNSGTATQLAYYASTGTAVSSTGAFVVNSGNPSVIATGTNGDVILTPNGTGNVRFGGSASAYAIADGSGALALTAVGANQNISLTASGSGSVTVPNGVASTSTTTGALKVTGGIGASGDIWSANLNTGAGAFSSTTGSTSKTTGAVTIAGGMGVAGRVNVNELRVYIAAGGGLLVDATGGPPYLETNISGTTHSIIGVEFTAGGLITGSSLHDIAIRSLTAGISLSGDNGGSVALRISSTNKIYALLPTSSAGLTAGQLWNNLGIVNVA